MVRKVLCLFILISIFLSGCSLFSKSEPEYKILRVPVYTCPPSLLNMPVIERPNLAIHSLRDDYPSFESMDSEDRLSLLTSAYTISIKQLMGYATKLENAINIPNIACEREERF